MRIHRKTAFSPRDHASKFLDVPGLVSKPEAMEQLAEDWSAEELNQALIHANKRADDWRDAKGGMVKAYALGELELLVGARAIQKGQNGLTRNERIEQAHAKMTECLEGISVRQTDARTNAMSARIVFGLTKDLVGHAALLTTLLNLGDDDVPDQET